MGKKVLLAAGSNKAVANQAYAVFKAPRDHLEATGDPPMDWGTCAFPNSSLFDVCSAKA